MEIYRVAFFGHRTIIGDCAIEYKLFPILRELLREKEYVEFYVGRNNDFDELCARLVRQAKRETGADNASLILALPYAMKDLPFYEKDYDEVIIPDACVGVHPEEAITARNRALVDMADLVIAYALRASGAMTAVDYARSKERRVISVADPEKYLPVFVLDDTFPSSSFYFD